MASTMEHMGAVHPNANPITSVHKHHIDDEKLVNVFYKLAEPDDNLRIEGTVFLLRRLGHHQAKHQGGDDALCPELKYAVHRLINGLLSTRKAARIGYFAALVPVLQQFNEVDTKFVIERMRFKKKEEGGKNTGIGSCLAHCALVKAGRVNKDGELISRVVTSITKVAAKNDELEIFCCGIMTALFEQTDKKRFRKYVLPTLLSVNKEFKTPFRVWLLFALARYYPKVINDEFLSEHWNGKELITKKSLPDLAQIMALSTSSHPNVHPVCIEITEATLTSPHFLTFWQKVIIEHMVGGQKEKTFLAYELLKVVLPKLTTVEQVRGVLSSGFVQNFIQSLGNASLMLHGTAKNFAAYLVDFMKKCEDCSLQFAVLESLLDNLGAASLYNVNKTIVQLINHLKPDAVKKLAEFLKERALNDNSDISEARAHAASMLCQLLNHQGIADDWEFQTEVLKFLLLYGTFDILRGDKKILKNYPQSQPMSTKLRESLQQCFVKGIDSVTKHKKSSRLSAEISKMMYEIAKFANTLLQHPDLVKPCCKDADELRETWNSAWEMIIKLNETARNGNVSETTVFQVLFTHLSLMLFLYMDEVVPVVEELLVVFSKAFSKQHSTDEDGQPSWIEVLVDLLLSLLSKNAHIWRTVVNSAFPRLIPFLTVEGIKPILDAINPEAATEGEDPLMDDDEEMEDDEVDEENDAHPQNGTAVASDNERDTSDDNSESDSEVEESGAVDEKLRAAVEKAMKNDDELSDKNLSDADDEELEKLDSELANLFRLQKETKNKELKREALMNFRLRCLELITLLPNHEPNMSVVTASLVPLVCTLLWSSKSPGQLTLHNRTIATLQQLTHMKLRVNQSEDEVDYMEIMHQLLAKAKTGNVGVHIAEAIIFLERCAANNSATTAEDVKKLNQVLLSEVANNLKAKQCHLRPEFLLRLSTGLLGTQAAVVIDLLEDLTEIGCDSEIRIYNRTQAWKLIEHTVSQSKKAVNSWDRERWRVLATKIGEYAAQVLDEPTIQKEYVASLMLAYKSIYNLHLAEYKEKLDFIKNDLLVKALPVMPKDSRRKVKELLSPGFTSMQNESSLTKEEKGKLKAEAKQQRRDKRRLKKEKYEAKKRERLLNLSKSAETLTEEEIEVDKDEADEDKSNEIRDDSSEESKESTEEPRRSPDLSTHLTPEIDVKQIKRRNSGSTGGKKKKQLTRNEVTFEQVQDEIGSQEEIILPVAQSPKRKSTEVSEELDTTSPVSTRATRGKKLKAKAAEEDGSVSPDVQESNVEPTSGSTKRRKSKSVGDTKDAINVNASPKKIRYSLRNETVSFSPRQSVRLKNRNLNKTVT